MSEQVKNPMCNDGTWGTRLGMTLGACLARAGIKPSQQNLVRSVGGCGKSQRFHDCVVKRGTDLGDFLIFAGGVDAIG
jgi:hypothetical protein